MSYVRVIYKDELDNFINNFKDLLDRNIIDSGYDRKKVLTFLNLFVKHLDESVTSTVIMDLRSLQVDKLIKKS